MAVLTALATLAFVWVAVALYLDRRFPQVVDPVYYRRWQYLCQQGAAAPAHTPTVVMFGSSRTYEGLDAVRLGQWLTQELGRPAAAANLGIPGGGFITDLLTWRRLRRDGIRPDLVLIEAVPGLFWGDCPAEMNDEAMPASRLCDFDVDVLTRYRGDTRPNLRHEVAVAKASALYSRRFALTCALEPRMVPFYDDDKRPFVWPENLSFDDRDLPPEERAKALARARKEYIHYLTEYQPARCEALRELLTSCREAGVPAALVVMPEGPTFRGWYAPETWPRVQDWLYEISHEFGIQVINAREWIDEEEFSDSHHLLPKGADRFSERLAREYIVPALRR
jgi:hypothetical protein